MKILASVLLLVSAAFVFAQSWPPATGNDITATSVTIGPPISVTSDSNTVFTQTGSSVYGLVTSGPTYGDRTKCAFAYRVTGEVFADYASVWRCNAYVWETTTPTWLMVLTTAGLGVGIPSTDPTPYPRSKLDVRGEIMSQGFQRIWADSNGNAAACMFNAAGEARWCMGMQPSLTSNGEDFVISRYKDGAWVSVQRFPY